ncbi:MAG: hypothetical protein GF364_04195 [Candidatus Lokiarchaeota archaeon]|nr:hypothetical protein [Candidatus Lokiarchaeota archaeon]
MSKMRHFITDPEWDKFYYHSRQIKGQKKIENESEEEEIKKVQMVLNRLKKLNYISNADYNLADFKDLRRKVQNDFFIYWTAINPPMERLLYALSDILRPKNILGIGIFTGNPVIWSLGPAIQDHYKYDKLVAVEIDKEHAKICQENMNKVAGEGRVKIFDKDGFEVLKDYSDKEIDLLYLDANGKDPCAERFWQRRRNTKRINYCLLKNAYSKLDPKGYAICHNAYQPSFRKIAKDYLEFTNNEDFFSKTATIGIDEMGIEFSKI